MKALSTPFVGVQQTLGLNLLLTNIGKATMAHTFLDAESPVVIDEPFTDTFDRARPQKRAA